MMRKNHIQLKSLLTNNIESDFRLISSFALQVNMIYTLPESSSISICKLKCMLFKSNDSQAVSTTHIQSHPMYGTKIDRFKLCCVSSLHCSCPGCWCVSYLNVLFRLDLHQKKRMDRAAMIHVQVVGVCPT